MQSYRIAMEPQQGRTEVRTLFTELRDEESEHVEMLQEEMAKLPTSAGVEVEYDPDDAPYLLGIQTIGTGINNPWNLIPDSSNMRQ